MKPTICNSGWPVSLPEICGDDFIFLPINKLTDVNPDRNHAYVLPNDDVYIVNYAGSRVIKLSSTSENPMFDEVSDGLEIVTVNKIQLLKVRVGEGLKFNDDGKIMLDPDKAYVLPAATASVLGGVIIGDYLSVETNGKLSVDVNKLLEKTQSDWNAEAGEYSAVLHKPFTTLNEEDFTVVNDELQASDQLKNPFWSSIQERPFETLDGIGFTVEGGVLRNRAEWEQVQSKPFNSIGDGLDVNEDGELNNTITAEDLGAQRKLVAGEGITIDETDEEKPVVSAESNARIMQNGTGVAIADNKNSLLAENSISFRAPETDDPRAVVIMRSNKGSLNVTRLQPDLTAGDGIKIDSTNPKAPVISVDGDLATEQELNDHIDDKENPHEVTAHQVGALTAEESSANVIDQLIGKEKVRTTIRLDFFGKKANSLVENRNVGKFGHENTTILLPNSTQFFENSQNAYNGLEKLDGQYMNGSITVKDGIAQELFSYDVLPLIRDFVGEQYFIDHGVQSAEDYVLVARNIVKSMSSHVVGSGLSANGDSLLLKTYVNDSNWSVGGGSNTSSSIQDLNHTLSNSNADFISLDGKIHATAYAGKSDGSTASQIKLDHAYVDIVIELSANEHIKYLIAAYHVENPPVLAEEKESGLVVMKNTKVSNQNWNTLTETGVYSVGQGTGPNSPTGTTETWGYLVVYRRATDWIEQTYYSSGAMYRRVMQGNPVAWSSWIKMASQSDLKWSNISDKPKISNGLLYEEHASGAVVTSRELSADFASESEAKEGTSDVKVMSPLRTKQAFSKYSSDVETTTYNSTTSPGLISSGTIVVTRQANNIICDIDFQAAATLDGTKVLITLDDRFAMKTSPRTLVRVEAPRSDIKAGNYMYIEGSSLRASDGIESGKYYVGQLIGFAKNA